LTGRLLRSCSLALLLVAAAALAPAGAWAVTGPLLSGSVSDSTSTLPGVTSVAVVGHYAYVTDYYAGRLTAIDISNPSSPTIVGSSPSSNELMNASTVNVAGGYAYVASKNRNGPSGSGSNDNGTGNAFTILDISTNPASPSIVGSIRDPNTLFGAYGVAVSGRYAYVASQGCLSGQPCPNHSVGCAFAVIDISNPAAPWIVAALHSTSLPQPWTTTGALGHVTSVALSGSHAYTTAAYQARLTVIDVANPLSPQIVASLKDTTNFSFPVDVAVSGNYAYVVDQVSPGRLTVVDISNPANPSVVASLSSTALSGAYRIRVRGPFAYISASSAAGVAVVDISNPLSPRLAGTVTDSAHLYKTTGLDVDPTASFAIASSPFLSTQTQPVYPPYALEPGGPTLTGTVSALTLDPSPVAVVIAPESEPANPTAQTSASFGFSVNDAISTVQCRLDEGGWTACTTPTSQAYSSLTPGSHTFTVQATDAAGNTSTAAYTWAVTAPPANVSSPAISGSAVEGQTLVASPGSWSGYPAPSLAYQWERCGEAGQSCVAIAGATSSTYTALSADVGSTLVVQVTASNGAGQAQASSAATAVVVSAPGPLTGLLDSFQRPDNGGPPGPGWTHMVVSSSSSTNDLYVVNQQVTGKAGSNADYWNPQTYGPNSEVWVTVAAKPNVDLDPVVLGLRFQNPGASNASGYQAYYIYRSSQPDQYKIVVRTNGTTSTTLASSSGPTLNPGDELLFRAIGTTLELWRFDAGAWSKILTASDSTYQGAGYLDLTARDSAVRLTNFGGGTLP
jgi:hypothetical protein